jgi:hypothetical protein
METQTTTEEFETVEEYAAATDPGRMRGVNLKNRELNMELEIGIFYLRFMFRGAHYVYTAYYEDPEPTTYGPFATIEEAEAEAQKRFDSVCEAVRKFRKEREYTAEEEAYWANLKKEKKDLGNAYNVMHAQRARSRSEAKKALLSKIMHETIEKSFALGLLIKEEVRWVNVK